MSVCFPAFEIELFILPVFFFNLLGFYQDKYHINHINVIQHLSQINMIINYV